MAELRAVSTRAVITPSGFTNHYDWGDLKADPAEWMRRYFDAFVYWANWHTCRLSLRLPKAAFRKTECNRATLSIQSSNTHWVLHWTLAESEDDDRFAMDDGHGWMRRLIPLRDELLRGDMRPLYLGWLAGIDTLREDALEPELLPGMAELSPAQQALAEFLEVDPDLLEAARSGSAASAPSPWDEAQRIAAWLDRWQPDAMKDVLRRIVLGQGQDAERQVKSHYAAWLKARRPASSGSPRRRVAELCELAGSLASVRREREAKAHGKHEAQRRKQREAKLRQLMTDPGKLWKAAHAHATRGGASGYAQAVSALAELAEGYAMLCSRDAFDRDLRRFLAPHAKRAALLRRLADASLWSE
ncbi:hypothetical protein [Xanthomonas translucens]|uniref:hypothetical protein n=1 Tax=Xanthomonas campestris pv. translucens TaxID=343 RepID=UPI00071B44EF|nr:hypothetical protein [Xanthomonas translucens]